MDKEREKAIEILEVVDHTLNELGIKVVVNEEMEELEGQEDNNAAIYGTAWYKLEDALTEYLKQKKVWNEIDRSRLRNRSLFC